MICFYLVLHISLGLIFEFQNMSVFLPEHILILRGGRIMDIIKCGEIALVGGTTQIGVVVHN